MIKIVTHPYFIRAIRAYDSCENIKQVESVIIYAKMLRNLMCDEYRPGEFKEIFQIIFCDESTFLYVYEKFNKYFEDYTGINLDDEY